MGLAGASGVLEARTSTAFRKPAEDAAEAAAYTAKYGIGACLILEVQQQNSHQHHEPLDIALPARPPLRNGPRRRSERAKTTPERAAEAPEGVAARVNRVMRALSGVRGSENALGDEHV